MVVADVGGGAAAGAADEPALGGVGGGGGDIGCTSTMVVLSTWTGAAKVPLTIVLAAALAA